MTPTRRRVLRTVAGALAAGLAGCSTDGESDTTTEPTETTTATTTTEPTETTTATTTTEPTETTATVTPAVQVRSHDDLGEILVDAEGMTLYMFDRDTNGEASSACTGDCASAWPPLTVDESVSAGDGVSAEVTTFERQSGERQVAAGGWPLYNYASDSSPGDAMGQGVNDVWWVLAPDGTPRKPGTETTTTDDIGY